MAEETKKGVASHFPNYYQPHSGVCLVHWAKCIWQGYEESDAEWTLVEHLRKQGVIAAEVVEMYLKNAPANKQIVR